METFSIALPDDDGAAVEVKCSSKIWGKAGVKKNSSRRKTLGGKGALNLPC